MANGKDEEKHRIPTDLFQFTEIYSVQKSTVKNQKCIESKIASNFHKQ